MSKKIQLSTGGVEAAAGGTRCNYGSSARSVAHSAPWVGSCRRGLCSEGQVVLPMALEVAPALTPWDIHLAPSCRGCCALLGESRSRRFPPAPLASRRDAGAPCPILDRSGGRQPQQQLEKAFGTGLPFGFGLDLGGGSPVLGGGPVLDPRQEREGVEESSGPAPSERGGEGAASDRPSFERESEEFEKGGEERRWGSSAGTGHAEEEEEKGDALLSTDAGGRTDVAWGDLLEEQGTRNKYLQTRRRRSTRLSGRDDLPTPPPPPPAEDVSMIGVYCRDYGLLSSHGSGEQTREAGAAAVHLVQGANGVPALAGSSRALGGASWSTEAAGTTRHVGRGGGGGVPAPPSHGAVEVNGVTMPVVDSGSLTRGLPHRKPPGGEAVLMQEPSPGVAAGDAACASHAKRASSGRGVHEAQPGVSAGRRAAGEGPTAARAVAGPTVPDRVKAASNAVRRLASAGEPLRPGLAEWEGRLSVRDMNAVLRIAVGHSWATGAAFFGWMREVGSCPNLFSYMELIKGLLRARQWAALWELGSEMLEGGKCPPDNIAYCTIISGAGRAGRPDEAARWFARMRGEGTCHPDAATYNTIIGAHGRAGELPAALSLADEMRAAGVAPDRVTYGTLLRACQAAGQPNVAEATFARMAREGLLPDLKACTTMVDMYGKEGLPDEALRVFREMRAGGCRPDAVCWNALIHGLGRAGRLDDAFAAFGAMQEAAGGGAAVAPDCVTYATLMWIYGRAGMHERAAAVLALMEARGIRPDEHTYGALLNAYAAAGLHDRAAGVFKAMQRQGCRYGEATYGAMVGVFSRAGRPADVEALVAEMQRRGLRPGVVVYSALVDHYGKSGDVARMEDVLREMARRRVRPNLYTYNMLIDVYGKAGRLEDAEAKFEEMQSAGIQPDAVTYSALINARGRAERYVEAIAAFEGMRASGCLPDPVVYGTMIKVYGDAGMYSAAVRLFDEMHRLGVGRDGVLFTAMLEIYKKAGMKDKARLLSERMQALGLNVVQQRPRRRAQGAGLERRKRRSKGGAKALPGCEGPAACEGAGSRDIGVSPKVGAEVAGTVAD